MFKQLSSCVSEWKPPVKSAMPLDVIRGAWPQIVGVEVSKHCLPSELKDETLTVLTRSGTWSQQLGFLETGILEGITALGLGMPVTILRFRVGKIALKTPLRVAKPRRAQQSMKLASPALEPATLEEMIARMKQRSLELQRMRVPRCTRCGLQLEKRGLCAPCRSTARQETVNRIIRMLIDVPWLGEDELRAALGPLTPNDVQRARCILLDRWKRDLDRLERKKTFTRGEPERAIAVSFVLLETGLPPDQITRAIVKYSLGPRLNTLLYGE